MSFLTTLLNVYSGRNQAKQQGYQNYLEQQQLQQGEEQVGIERERAKLEAERLRYEQQVAEAQSRGTLFQQGLDASGKPLPPTVWPKDLQQEIPGNKGLLQSSPDTHISLLLRRAMYTQNPAERDALFKAAKEEGDTQRALSYAGLNRAKIPVEQQRVLLLKAQTKAVNDLPARAREIAHGHDQASIDRNAATLANRAELAQYSAQTRLAVANLAGAYMFKTHNADAAVRMAIDDYNNRTKVYLGQTNYRNLLFNPGLYGQAVDPTQDPYSGFDPSTMPGFPTMPNTGGLGGYGGGMPTMPAIPNYGQGGTPGFPSTGANPFAPQAALQPPFFSKPLPFRGRDLTTFQQIEEALVGYGLPPEYAPQMATIAMTESGGNPTNVNPAAPHAAGLFQINPAAHGQGNWLDPATNIQYAIKLFMADKARGGTGFKDWEASRLSGGFGGWGQFFGGTQPAPPPTGGAPRATVPGGHRISRQAMEQNVRDALAGKLPGGVVEPAVLRQRIEAAVQAGRLTRADADAAERLLTPFAPTPVPGGG